MGYVSFEFHEIVAKVEERFRPLYDSEKVANAKTDGQMQDASTQVSIGWFVVLARFGVAVRFGNTRPDIDVGDTLVLTASKIPKKPDAPQLTVVPPEPPSDDAAATIAALTKERDEWRQKAVTAEQVKDPIA